MILNRAVHAWKHLRCSSRSSVKIRPQNVYYLNIVCVTISAIHTSDQHCKYIRTKAYKNSKKTTRGVNSRQTRVKVRNAQNIWYKEKWRSRVVPPWSQLCVVDLNYTREPNEPLVMLLRVFYTYKTILALRNNSNGKMFTGNLVYHSGYNSQAISDLYCSQDEAHIHNPLTRCYYSHDPIYCLFVI